MLSGKLWPAHPKPYNGECLSSWLVRCAHSNGLKLQTFCRLEFGSNYQLWNRDIDRYIPQWLLGKISEKASVSCEELEKHTLALFEGRLFPELTLSGQLRWLCPLVIKHRLHNGYGMQFCPQCLAEGAEPYYRLSWRVGFYTFCPYHQIIMHDRCTECGASISFHRCELGKPGIYKDMDMACCWKCGFDLRQSPNQHVRFWSKVLFERWAAQLRAIDRQFVNCGKFDFDRLILLHQLCRLIVSKSLAPDLQSYICNLCGQPKQELIETKVAFEQRSLAERHYVISLAKWLLLKYPKRVLLAIGVRVIRKNWLYRDISLNDKSLEIYSIR